MASQASEDEIKEYKKMFIEMDTNGDGQLSLDEIKVGLEK